MRPIFLELYISTAKYPQHTLICCVPWYFSSVKIYFRYLLVLYVLTALSMSQICPKWSLSYFQPTLMAIFFYHSNGKSQINTRLVHLGYCLKKLVKNKFWFLALWGGGQNSPFMHVALSLTYRICALSHVVFILSDFK